MTAVSDEMRAEFCRRGFVVVPGVLSSRQVSAARETVAGLLAGQPAPAGRAGHSLWPRFGAGGHPLLDFYRQAGVGELAGQLLRPGLAVQDPDFAQVAITIPPFPHRPGVPHVDGLTHLRFGQYLAERGADALARVAEMGPGPYPLVELGEPVQATGAAGSVLFAHYLLAHNSGGHFGAAGAERRETIYYRLHADGHRQRWKEAVTSPLLEFRQP
jgi:hypothetical protein